MTGLGRQDTLRVPIRNYFSDLWLLIRLRWLMTWNAFRRNKLWMQVLRAIGMLWVAGWVGFLSGLVGLGIGSLLRRYPDQGLEPLLPGVILTIVTLLVLLSSFGIALGSLFLSSDLETLMTAPVSRRAVFTSKILDGLWAYYAIVLLTAIPALVTYGFGLHYGPAYYVLAIIAVLGTPLFPAALGAILVMLVARFAPARRVREVLGLVGALIGIACSLIGQTSRVWFSRLNGANSDPQAILARLRQLATVPIPSIVAGRGLAAAGTGHLLPALTELVGFLLLTFGTFALCVLAADRLYSVGWVRMQSSGTASRSRARVAHDAASAGWLGRAPAWAAIALKDWRVIPRDLRNFAQLLSPLVILPVIYFNLLSGSNRRSHDLGNLLNGLGRNNIDPTGIVIAFGVLTASALIFRRIASNSISMEGQAWWLLKIAPVDGRELLRGKFVAAMAPFAALSTVLLLGAAIWQGFSILGFLYGLFGIELLGATFLALAVAASVPWARLDWDDPRKMTSGWGSLISLAVGAVVAGLAGLFLCLPLLVSDFAPNFTAIAWVLGPLLALAVAVATVWLSLSLGAGFLTRVGRA